jgi:hypothetical protein
VQYIYFIKQLYILYTLYVIIKFMRTPLPPPSPVTVTTPLGIQLLYKWFVPKHYNLLIIRISYNYNYKLPNPIAHVFVTCV